MVETSYGWRVKYVWFPKEIVILVVTIAFVSIPNDRFHCVTVTATAKNDDNNAKNVNVQNTNNRRYDYNTGGDELYAPYNPLWREEQIYTGERRGPVTTTDNEDSSSLRRPRRTGGKSSPAHSPLAPHMSIERYRQQHQRRQSSYGEFPLQSADIGSTESRSNNIRSGYNQKPRFGTKRGNRKWLFPIDFRRQKGRLNIGFSTATDPKKQSQNRPPRRSQASSIGLLTAATNATASSRREKVEHVIQKMLNPTAVTSSPRQHLSSRTGNGQKKNDLQVSFSLDPFTLVTLLQNGATSIVGIASVYIGTLKLLGPMILAKQCLMMVTKTINYGYNGRYVRKAPTKRIRNLEQSYLDKHDASAAARAATRSVLQILCMSCTGRFIGFVLDQTPCLLRPFWICQWWYGVVWLASIYAIGLVCQEWVFGCLAQTDNKMHSFVSIQPKSDPMHLDCRRNSSVNVQNRRRNNMVQPLFRFLQRISQDPEEWMNNLLRIVPRWQDRNNYTRGSILMAEGEGVSNIELDPLLFPSTWKPLSIVTFLALSRAIYQSFCTKVSSSGLVHKLGDAACRENNQYLIMRSFIIQKTLHSEWHRVFVQERRVALGAGISVIGLLALMWSMYSVSTVDRIATIAMIPVLMAQMISTWINILLTYNASGMSADAMTWRDMSSHLNMINDWS
jgi:hypothetical protein